MARFRVMTYDYVELRCRSWYSFGGGAASVAEVVTRAAEFGYPALGLADRANLCGALEFALACGQAGIQSIHGVSLPVAFGDLVLPVTLLAEPGTGCANVCRVTSLAYAAGGRVGVCGLASLSGLWGCGA